MQACSSTSKRGRKHTRQPLARPAGTIFGGEGGGGAGCQASRTRRWDEARRYKPACTFFLPSLLSSLSCIHVPREARRGGGRRGQGTNWSRWVPPNAAASVLLTWMVCPTNVLVLPRDLGRMFCLLCSFKAHRRAKRHLEGRRDGTRHKKDAHR